MFSVIERKLKKQSMFLPTTLISLKELEAIRVKYLTHDFFKNYSDPKYYNSIRPGNRVRDNAVVDIRGLMYCPSGESGIHLQWKEIFWTYLGEEKCQSLRGRIA